MVVKPRRFWYNNDAMERRIHFYVSRKNALTLLMTLCMICSVVARVVIYSGMEGVGVWSQIVLPVAATVLYVSIVITNGQEMFYKTAIPVWMMVIYSGLWIRENVENRMMVYLFWIALIFFATLYTDIISGHRKYGAMLLAPVVLAPVAFILYFYRDALLHSNFAAMLPVLPDLLMLLGAFILIFALRIHTDDKYHPTWGDRCDGRRVRTLPPMAQVSPYIMVTRNTSTNYFEEALEITNVDRYIRKKRKEGLTSFGITHVLLATYIRTLCEYPGLNRFLAGQKVYQRGDDIQYCMVIKKEMKADSPDTAIKVHLTPYDTADDIYYKLQAVVEKEKTSSDLDSSFDATAGALNLIPGLVLKFAVWLLKTMDYFGLLPKFLLEVSPFHGSLFFTSMGSLGIPPIYHHLYDFGNLPVFGSFGMKRKANEVLDDGTVVTRKYVDVKFCLDERIVDGYYYAAFFKHYKRILQHPDVLDNPPDEVIPDIP